MGHQLHANKGLNVFFYFRRPQHLSNCALHSNMAAGIPQTQFAQMYDGSLINTTVLTVLLSLVSCVLLPTYVTSIHIISSPLTALKFWCIIYTIWISASLWWLQKQHSSSHKAPVMSYKHVTQRVLCACAGIPLIHLMLVLFGAPLMENVTETLHLAMLMVVLGLVPPLCVLPASSWTRVYALHAPQPGLETIVYACTLGTAVGAWVGAMPIPLDWDRPWQVWPISCAIGAVLGYVVAVVVATVYDTYRVKNDDDKYKLG